jgi:cell division protein FtsQ
MDVYSSYRKPRKGKNIRIKKKKNNGRASGEAHERIQFRKLGIVLFAFTTTVIVLLKLATWLYAEDMFIFRELQFEGTRYAKIEELKALVALDSTKNLLDLDLKNIASQVREHPMVDNVWISRKLPATLQIRIQEREPLAILNRESLLAIDDKGRVLPELADEMFVDYPVISNIESMPNDELVNNELNRILEFLNAAKKNEFQLYSRISEISYSQKVGIYFYLTDFAIPVILGKDNLESKGENLMQVIHHLQTEDALSSVSYVDARFKDRIIVKDTRA